MLATYCAAGQRQKQNRNSCGVHGLWSHSLSHQSICGDPVNFPRLSSVTRECLFKTARIGSDVGNDKSNKNGSAIQCFLVKKLAASILKLADRGLAHAAAVAVGKIEAPLMGLEIVQAQVQPFEVTCGAIGLELHQVGATIPN